MRYQVEIRDDDGKWWPSGPRFKERNGAVDFAAIYTIPTRIIDTQR